MVQTGDIASQQTTTPYRIHVTVVWLHSRFHNVGGLMFLIGKQLEDLQDAHLTLKKTLDKLSGKPSSRLINQCVNCCLRITDPKLHARKSVPFPL